MASRTTIGWAALAVLAVAAIAASGCQNDADADSKGGSVASSLSKGIDFEDAMLLDAPMPKTTDPSVTLLSLGPPPILHPGVGGLMSLEVDDPKHRAVAATLMQFGGDDSHVRVPVPPEQTGDVVENEFDLSDQLCMGLCDAIFTILVRQKVELEDGAISAATEREVVLDCRKAGDHNACGGAPGPGAEIEMSNMLCGDVTHGEIALSGDPVLDSHLDAVRQLQLIADALGDQLDGALSVMAIALGLDPMSSAKDVADALDKRLIEETEVGLALLLGNQGCAVRRSQVEFALMACDPDGVASLDALQCSGVCEPTDDVSECSAAASSGCRGFVEDVACDGQCVGACETELDEPAPCAGTCIGTCEGSCPDDGTGACAGPCDGNCTGSCRATSMDTCKGECTGICDVSVDGAPGCDTPLVAYCIAEEDAALTCEGDCFGDVSVDTGAAACRISAVALGHALPRCTPPLVQLSFGFAMGLDADAQGSLASLVQGLNAPLATLVDVQSRMALLVQSAAELDAASAGVEDVLAMRLADDPDDEKLACAEDQVPNASMWLSEEAMSIETRQADIEAVLAVVDIAQ